MIGPAALIVGLLLLLTWALGARVPGEATFASPGLLLSGPTPAAGGLSGSGRRMRDPIRAFLLAPVHPASWAATAAILAGFFVEVVAFVFVAGMFSAGTSLLLFGIGIVVVALGIEGARIVARIERRRATWVDPRPLSPHHYPALRGGWRDLLRAEFASESRWRDVLYVGVNLPLAFLEFALVGIVWTAALGLLSLPFWIGLGE